MRLDDPRLAALARRRPAARRRSCRSSRSRPTTGCASPRRCSRTAGCGTSTARSTCPRTGCSTSGGSSRLATCSARYPRGWAWAWARRVRGLLAPLDGPGARERRRADADQRVVVARPGPRLHPRGGPRDGDLVADADAHVRAAHDLVRRVLQPGRRGRVDLVLGRVGGDLADRRPGVQRPAVRRGPVLRGHRPRRRAPRAHLAAAPARRAAGARRPRVAAARRRARGPGRGLHRGARAPAASMWRSTRHPSGERRHGPGDVRPPESSRSTPRVAQRLIADFIRGQLRQAGFERAVLGLSGGIDSALVAYLAADAIGAERLHCVLMPYRTSSPASREDAEEVVAGSAARRRWSRSRPWSTATSGRMANPARPVPRDSRRHRSGAATSWPGCG